MIEDVEGGRKGGDGWKRGVENSENLDIYIFFLNLEDVEGVEEGGNVIIKMRCRYSLLLLLSLIMSKYLVVL